MGRSLLLIPVLALLAGCSRPSEAPPSAASLVREVKAASLADAASLASRSALRCADSANCPENVGLFLATKPDGVLTCTAFLIGDDLAATNSHCFPKQVKDQPSLCADRVRVIFPANGERAEESVGCASFLGASERPNALSPDLAVIRLARAPGRRAFAVKADGVAPGTTYGAFKVNPLEGTSGELVRQSCLGVNKSYRFPLFGSAADPLFTVGDCKSLPGNSGSPLIDDSGVAVGVLQTDFSVSDQARAVWGPQLLPGEDFAPLVLGTSLRCLKSADPFALADNCTPIDDQLVTKPRIDDLLPSLDQRRRELLDEAGRILPRPFRWDFVTTKNQTLFREETLRPGCFEPARSWGENFSSLDDAKLETQLPRFRADLRFNRYMQVSATMSLVGSDPTTVEFSPARAWREGGGEVRWGDRSETLTFCGN